MTRDVQEQKVLDGVPQGLFIGGEWREAASGKTFAIEDPATGESLMSISDAGTEDALAALDAASAAQAGWAATPPRERGEILRRSYQALVDRADELALLMTLEMGKPLAQSKGEIVYGAEFLRWFSEEAVRIDGRYTREPAGNGRLMTMKQPVGPCLLITPWNFPIAMGTRKIGPAIAAGCTMVVKPAQQTPLSMQMLAQVLTEAGLPAGVLNVIATSSASGTTAPLFEDSRLRKVSFTGSTPVGKKLMQQSAGTLLRMSMELGGNAPFLVFEDADIDAAVDCAMIAKMRNMGESCVAANRFHVQDSVAEEFSHKLAERMAAQTVGRGTEPGVDVGPLIDENQRTKVAELVGEAVGKGATVLTGGSAPDHAGYFFTPTVLSEVPAGSALLREEIFGPVAPVSTFTDEAEAMRAANDSEFGLVAYVYTENLKRGLRVVEGLEVGMVGLNRGLVSNAAAPFGGIKESGFGREGGYEGIAEYVSTKYVAVDL